MAGSGSAGSKDTRCRFCPWLWGLVIAAALGFVVWYAKNPPAAPQRPGFGQRALSTPVRVAEAAPARIPFVIQAIGTVTAFNTVAVRSRVDGELVEIAFQDGQLVKEGELLARIDPRTYQVALDQALGQQAQNLAQLKNAQRDLQRYRQLFKQDSIARQTLESQEALVQQLQGQRQSDQAAVDSARLQLDFTRITSPLNGRLGLRRLDQGNLISAANTDGLVTIAQTQPISVMFTIPQVQLPDVVAQIRDGKTLAVTLYDRDDRRRLAQGELMALDNQIDTATGTLRLKARFDNEDHMLFPNQFVNARLHVDTLDAPVTIPVAAAQYGSIGTFVYLALPDDTVQLRKVELGRGDGERIEVIAGLTVGDRVVVEGTDRLRDGASIQIRTAPLGPDATDPAQAAGALLQGTLGSPDGAGAGVPAAQGDPQAGPAAGAPSGQPAGAPPATSSGASPGAGPGAAPAAGRGAHGG